MKDEALKLALDALDNLLYWDNGKSDYDQAREAITAIKQALAAQPAAPKGWKLVPVMPAAWIDSVMEQAQVFASAWSLVGSRFDSGNEMKNAEQAKAELRVMLISPPTPQPAAQPAVPDALFRHAPEHPQYIQGWNDCRAEMLKGLKP
jgi:hypothetical protein